MAVLTNLIEQLKTLWSRWTMSQRVGISAATVACVAAVAGTLIWATRADYVVLASQLTPQRAAEIVGILETEQISTELNYSGSAVSVPRSDVSRARLALKDVWEPVAEADTSMSGAFPGSPRAEEDRRQRQLEVRIGRSIAQIRGIRAATVHISRPEPSPFVSDQTPTTASVIIEPVASTSVTPSVAESIISLVARAVEGLAPDGISLMDTAGRQFNVADGIGSTMEGQFDYQQRVELRLATKAESMLATLLGDGKAVVRVSAAIDFRESTRTDRTYDPDGKVKRTETIETVEQTGGLIPSGEVGTASNVLSTTLGAEENGGKYKKEIISADYDNATTEEVTRDIPGKITRLTIAAIVELPTPTADPAAADGGGAPNAAAAATPAALDTTLIESIVKQAVGFDQSRGDEIQVLTASLDAGTPLEAPGLLSVWEQYEPLIHTTGMGLIAAMAFLMGFLLLRKMQPVIVTDPSADQQLSLEEVRQLAALSDQAKSNPDVAARVLAAWLGEESSEDQEEQPISAKAA
ncbi:MAG: flagellar basal-body MS-ring/collar protein FliF [Fuerstiella sp.]